MEIRVLLEEGVRESRGSGSGCSEYTVGLGFIVDMLYALHVYEANGRYLARNRSF
jgi:hypothetical protein